MLTDKKAYLRRTQERSHRSGTAGNALRAFVSGGAVCLLGQALHDVFLMLGLAEDRAGPAVSVVLIFLGALLTALNCYDRIASFCLAGLLVPITGFSNSVASAAMDCRSEGLMTVCAKIFTVAGPVIVCGTLSSVLYGAVLFLLQQI